MIGSSDEIAPAHAFGPLTVGVIGAGTMGTGIARLFFRAGHSIRLYDEAPGLVAQWLDSLPPDQRIAADGRAIVESPSLITAALDADLIVEAVAEDREVKSSVLQELSIHATDSCIIATNTSSFPIDTLAQDCKHPERFLGTHFFNPADVIPGVEVIPGEATSPESVAQVMEWLTAAGKRPAIVRSSAGFIANRLQMALFLECLRCIEEGLATPEAIDTVVSTTFGFRLPIFGPFAIADMAGLDVYQSILETLTADFGDRFATPAAVTDRTARGDLGLKTGKGFLAYDSRVRAELPGIRDEMYAGLEQALKEITARRSWDNEGSV